MQCDKVKILYVNTSRKENYGQIQIYQNNLELDTKKLWTFCIRGVAYVHHAGIINVYPECKLFLMTEVLQVDGGKFPE